MKRILNMAAALAAGAFVMYFLDARWDRRRRLSARGHRGVPERIGPGSPDRESSSATVGGDAQLRSQVQTRLGQLVSHPAAIEVEVSDHVVRLTGQVLAQELDGLLLQLTEMPQVRKVHNALTVLNDPSGFSSDQDPSGQTRPSGRPERTPEI